MKSDALVISLQNGVDNAETLARHLTQAVVPVAVYVATDMPGPGEVHHHGRSDLVIGPMHAAAAADAALAARLQRVVDLFASAQVTVRVSPDVIGELWRKLMVNCAYNAVSALTRQPFGRMAALPAVVDLQRAVVHEVVAVAQAAGQTMDLDASMTAMAAIAKAVPGQHSSTAQDMARGRITEIDHLNGFVVRRGAELGVTDPGEPGPACAGQAGRRQPQRRLSAADAELQPAPDASMTEVGSWTRPLARQRSDVGHPLGC